MKKGKPRIVVLPINKLTFYSQKQQLLDSNDSVLAKLKKNSADAICGILICVLNSVPTKEAYTTKFIE